MPEKLPSIDNAKQLVSRETKTKNPIPKKAATEVVLVAAGLISRLVCQPGFGGSARLLAKSTSRLTVGVTDSPIPGARLVKPSKPMLA